MFLMQECIILSHSYGIWIRIPIKFMRFRTLNSDLPKQKSFNKLELFGISIKHFFLQHSWQ
jgi:hypothetical protein